MNITDPHITAKAKAERMKADHDDKVALFGCALLVLALAIFINAT